jgi:hypothetical protein
MQGMEKMLPPPPLNLIQITHLHILHMILNYVFLVLLHLFVLIIFLARTGAMYIVVTYAMLMLPFHPHPLNFVDTIMLNLAFMFS